MNNSNSCLCGCKAGGFTQYYFIVSQSFWYNFSYILWKLFLDFLRIGSQVIVKFEMKWLMNCVCLRKPRMRFSLVGDDIYVMVLIWDKSCLIALKLITLKLTTYRKSYTKVTLNVHRSGFNFHSHLKNFLKVVICPSLMFWFDDYFIYMSIYLFMHHIMQQGLGHPLIDGLQQLLRRKTWCHWKRCVIMWWKWQFLNLPRPFWFSHVQLNHPWVITGNDLSCSLVASQCKVKESHP